MGQVISYMHFAEAIDYIVTCWTWLFAPLCVQTFNMLIFSFSQEQGSQLTWPCFTQPLIGEVYTHMGITNLAVELIFQSSGPATLFLFE